MTVRNHLTTTAVPQSTNMQNWQLIEPFAQSATSFFHCAFPLYTHQFVAIEELRLISKTLFTH